MTILQLCSKIEAQRRQTVKDRYKLADAEREILMVLWEYTEPIQTKDLLELVNLRGRNWKRQTLNTLLSRLEKKGIVNRKYAYVQAALSEKELLQRQTQEILDDFYGGKLGDFCAALVGDTKIRKEDAEELNALIDKMQNK